METETVLDTPEVENVEAGADVSTSDFDSTNIEDESTTVIVNTVIPENHEETPPAPVVVGEHEHADIVAEIHESESRIHARMDSLCDEILAVIGVESEGGEGSGETIVEIPAEPETPETIVTTSETPPSPSTRRGRRHRFGR